MKKLFLIIFAIVLLGGSIFYYKTSNRIIVSANSVGVVYISDRMPINLVKADLIYPPGQAFVQIDRTVFVEIKKNHKTGLWEPVNAYINKPHCGRSLLLFNTCSSVFLKGRVVAVDATKKELDYFAHMGMSEEEKNEYNTQKYHKIVYGIEDSVIPYNIDPATESIGLSLFVDDFGNVAIKKMIEL